MKLGATQDPLLIKLIFFVADYRILDYYNVDVALTTLCDITKDLKSLKI